MEGLEASWSEIERNEVAFGEKTLEMRGIDPRASHMLSERSTIWATPPDTNWLFIGYL